MDCAVQSTPEYRFSEEIEKARQRVDPQILSLAHLAQYTSGDEPLEQELLGLFKEQAILQFNNIEQAQEKVDWVMAVHTIKGSARGIGAGQVAELSSELESVGFSGNIDARKAMTNRLKHAVAVCIVTIETLIPDPN